MHKIFYEDIFISDLITNKSMTIDEMLEQVDFDEEAFRDKHGFEALDPADFRVVYFNFEEALMGCEVITQSFKEVDGNNYTYRHKELKLGDELFLYLYDGGEATLEYRRHEIETFYWDAEAADMFADINNIKVADLFAMMYRKRWGI